MAQAIITQGLGVGQQRIPTLGYGRDFQEFGALITGQFDVEVSTAVRIREMALEIDGEFSVILEELNKFVPMGATIAGVFEVDLDGLRRYRNFSTDIDGVFLVEISTLISQVLFSVTIEGSFEVEAILKAVRDFGVEINGSFEVDGHVYILADWEHLDQISFIAEE